MNTKNTTTSKTEVTQFKLELPGPLSVNPKWTVPVSKNYTARIFEVQVPERTTSHGVEPAYTKYLVVVRHNKTGLPSRNINIIDHYGRHDDCQVDLLGVMLRLEAIALILAPKVKTTVQNDDDDL